MKHVLLTCFIYSDSVIVPELRANLRDIYTMLLFALRRTHCAFKHITLITDVQPDPKKCQLIYAEYQKYITRKIQKWGYVLDIPPLTSNQKEWTHQLADKISSINSRPVKEVYKKLTHGYQPSISSENIVEYLSIFAHCLCISGAQSYLNACRWVFSSVMSGDQLLIYYTGHGTRRVSRKTYLDIPLGKQMEYVSGDQLNELMFTYLPSKTNVIFILDCCHAGGVFNYSENKNSSWNINILVICSSLSKEKAGYYYTPDKEILGSLFTYHFLIMATSKIPLKVLLESIQEKITQHGKNHQQINLQANHHQLLTKGRLPSWICE